jgi:Cft2 family RNA processing exonuclease
MLIESKSGGILLPEIGLWLDSRESCPATWISHAHSDHAQSAHGRVFATPATLSLYQQRVDLDKTARLGLVPVAYGDTVEWNGARLTALRAAHIVGAAQLLVEYRGERLVYTGDIKLRAPMCGETTEIVPCDHLIIESTFGLPVFHFLDRDEARRRIVAFAQECLEEESMPVFLGYALGRGQEIVYALRQAGIPTAVHGAIARFLPFYAENGYDAGGWESYEQGTAKGKALVVVPGMRKFLEASGKNVRIAYVSGWAALSNARTRVGAEHLIPYSDHADFEELIEIVERCGARRVDVVHGYTEAFARILTLRGIEAQPLGAPAEAVQE